MDDFETFRKLAQCENKEQMQRVIYEYNESQKLTFTNADRIRAMSDEELSTLLCDVSDCSSCRWGEYSGCTVREWLKQPAEVDND